MALSQRLDSLKKRHSIIEQELHDEEQRRSPDIALLQQLKREKLILKDEMYRLEATEEFAA